MDELAGVIRGSAKGLGIVVQTREGFSKRLIPNLATKIIGRLGSADDYRTLGADLAMNPLQIDWARKNLKPGIFAAQLAEGPWREPFVMHVPLVRPPRRVDDEEATRSVERLSGLPIKPAEEYARWQPEQVVTVTARARRRELEPADPARQRLTEMELAYLRAVVATPGETSGFYARSLRISGGQGSRIRDHLVALGYLREHRVATGQRGRHAKVVQPLDAARQALAAPEGGSP